LRVLETRRAAGRALLDRDALIIVVSISLKYPPRQAEYFCFRSKNSSLL
jgi:excinuclease UvrABC helicase subunit UvrB